MSKKSVAIELAAAAALQYVLSRFLFDVTKYASKQEDDRYCQDVPKAADSLTV